MNTDWRQSQVGDLLVPFEVERSKQVFARDYRPRGKFPVIDQGKDPIAGYTDDGGRIVCDNLPVVVFGDHTRVFKYVDFPFAVGADGTKLLKPRAGIDPRYFYYACLTLDLPNRGYNRHFKDLKEQSLGYPEDENEQRRIAAMLGELERAGELEAAQDRATRELKQSVMRQLFTRGLRNEPLCDTPVGPLPESWSEIKIADLGEIVTGTTPKTAKREYYDGGEIPFIAPGDLGGSFYIERWEKKITEAGAGVSRLLPKYATCFVCIGSSIGKVGVTTAEWSTTNQQINAVIAGDDYDPLYVGYLLTFRSAHIASHASPSPVPIMSKGKFGEVSAWASRDKDEQREIAAILGTLDRKIALHVARRRARQDLFRSTLHALMTARLRVPEDIVL